MPAGQITRSATTAAVTGPTSYRTDHFQPPPPKDSLPPPPLEVLQDTNDESVTEVSFLSEESYFTHDEETLIHSGSFRHFEVDVEWPVLSAENDYFIAD